MKVSALDEFSIVVKWIFLKFSNLVKLLGIYKILRQTAQYIDTEVLYFSAPPKSLVLIILLSLKES